MTEEKWLFDQHPFVPRFDRDIRALIGALEQFEARLLDSLENVLGIRVAVRLVEPHSIQRSEGKAKRIIDKRNA